MTDTEILNELERLVRAEYARDEATPENFYTMGMVLEWMEKLRKGEPIDDYDDTEY